MITWKKHYLKLLIGRLKKERIKAGVSCRFMRITKTIGIKTYYSKRDRDTAWRRQCKAEALGVAPKTGERIDLEDYEHPHPMSRLEKYAFLTQVAQPLRSLSCRDYDILEKAFRKLRLGTADLCEPNCGKIGKRVVCIDFCTAST